MNEPRAFKYKLTIEGVLPAISEDGAKQWIMGDVSYAARFGMTIKNIIVEAEPLISSPYDGNGVNLGPRRG